MLILGIETTCDETSAAIVRDGREVLSNVVASQIGLHAKFWGDTRGAAVELPAVRDWSCLGVKKPRMD